MWCGQGMAGGVISEVPQLATAEFELYNSWKFRRRAGGFAL